MAIGKGWPGLAESTFLASQLIVSLVNGSLSFDRNCGKVSSP